MQLPCFDGQLEASDHCLAESARLIDFVGAPPGLEAPSLGSHNCGAACALLERLKNGDGADVRSKLKAYAAKPTGNDLAMHVLQQAQWNLASARAAQESAYINHVRTYLHHNRCNDAPACTQTLPQLGASWPKESLVGCGNLATANKKVVPRRPPGIWNSLPRTSSWSSNASTRASSNGESRAVEKGPPSGKEATAEQEHRVNKSQQLQVDILNEHSFFPGGLRLSWHVDARKLRSCDAQIVSPSFEMFPGSEFKLMIKSESNGQKRGQSGFKAARGRGGIELKCVASSSTDLPLVTFTISLNVLEGKPQAPRLVKHDFKEEAIYGVSQDSQAWDFGAAVDPASKTFVVCVEVAATPAPRS